jgi:hypothetical protein
MTQALSAFKAKAGPCLKEDLSKKFIVYPNTLATTVECMTPKLCHWMDDKGYKANLLKIIGTLLHEQKFYHIHIFMWSNALSINGLETCHEEKQPFNLWILTATSGSANAQEFTMKKYLVSLGCNFHQLFGCQRGEGSCQRRR